MTKFFKFTLILFLAFSWVFNSLTINFNEQGRSQILLPEKDFVGALRFRDTRTVKMAEVITTATTTAATTTAVVNEEEIDVAEGLSETEIQTELPSPPLYRRILGRRVITDKKATHSCEIEAFRADIFGRDTVALRVILTRDSSAPQEVEIGSLPDGVDITIAKNGAYPYVGSTSIPSANIFDEETAMTTELIVTPPDVSYNLVEVIYTLDGVQWKSLGFVDKDEFGNKYFETPIETASDWDLISNIQIAIQSVPVVDGVVPTISLDSVWLELECERSWDDPYLPPGEKRGDTIISEILSGDVAVVLVERKLPFVPGKLSYELWLSTRAPEQSDNFISSTEMTLANKSSALESANVTKIVSAETLNSTDSAMSTLTVMAESFDASSSTPTNPVDASNLSSSYLLQTKNWRFITDISLSASTQIMIVDGNIFWFESDGSIVWRFNISSNAYESVSVNAGELLQLHFESQAGEPRIFQKSAEGFAEILEIIE